MLQIIFEKSVTLTLRLSTVLISLCEMWSFILSYAYLKQLILIILYKRLKMYLLNI